MKKRGLIIVIIFLFLTGCSFKTSESKLTFIGTNFPCYDFLRAITKGVDDVNVEMLLSPGVDMHHFEPTPKDIISVDKSDLFVYIGGESEEYVTEMLKDLSKNEKNILKLIDKVELLEEELKEGMEDDDSEDNLEKEYDEHIWTSLKNAVRMIEQIKNKVIEIDVEHKEIYEKNANDYIKEIEKLDNKIKTLVSTSKRKIFVFADRFPLQYFANLYNIDYYAAFKGCSESTEASSKTISFLIDKIKSNDIPVIFKIELSNGNIAETIKDSTNAKILEFNSMHNISKDDFENGETYVSIMKKNIENLTEALN